MKYFYTIFIQSVYKVCPHIYNLEVIQNYKKMRNNACSIIQKSTFKKVKDYSPFPRKCLTTIQKFRNFKWIVSKIQEEEVKTDFIVSLYIPLHIKKKKPK